MQDRQRHDPTQGGRSPEERGDEARYGEPEVERGGLGYGHSDTGASSAGPGGQHRGFGRGEYGHARHRGELGELGRSSVYGQPPGESGPYPGRPVKRQTMAEPSHGRMGPKGYTRSDERIQEFICERLAQYHWLDVHEVSVAVAGGEVMLEGSVPDRRMKYEIEDVAAGCWGVREVDNRLHVTAPQAAPMARREGPARAQPAPLAELEPGQWRGSARPASARALGRMAR